MEGRRKRHGRYSHQSQEPDRKANTRALLAECSQTEPGECGDGQTCGNRVQSSRGNCFGEAVNHCFTPDSSISRNRFNSFASSPRSSRILRTKSSCESLKNRLTRWLISDRVASLRSIAGA